MNFKRILAIRLDNIGDVVMLSPGLQALREAYPLAEIVLMVSPAGSQVATLIPAVDDVITWRSVWQDIAGSLPFDPQREMSLISLLREREFDAAFIFTSFRQSPYPPAYVCYLAGIPVRVGYSREFGGGILSFVGESPPDDGHQAERNLDLLESAGIPVRDRRIQLEIPAETRTRVDRILEDAGISPGTAFILLAPGASCAARRYAPARYATVAHLLADESDLPVVITGSSRDAAELEPVTSLAEERRDGKIISLVGQTTVPELAALIRRSGLVIANNSASLHFADAFERPMVILYSGTDFESTWAPRFSPARILRRPTDCSPCYRFICPYSMECLDIPPEEVVEAALELLTLNTPTPSGPLVLEETFG